MRAFAIILLAWAASGVAVAQDAGTSTSAVPAIHFDLAKPRVPNREKLPEATTLDGLTYAPSSAVNDPMLAGHPLKVAAKRRVSPNRSAAPIPAFSPAGKPMSAWRRAYIAKHHHQPPVKAK